MPRTLKKQTKKTKNRKTRGGLFGMASRVAGRVAQSMRATKTPVDIINDYRSEYGTNFILKMFNPQHWKLACQSLGNLKLKTTDSLKWNKDSKPLYDKYGDENTTNLYIMCANLLFYRDELRRAINNLKMNGKNYYCTKAENENSPKYYLCANLIKIREEEIKEQYDEIHKFLIESGILPNQLTNTLRQ